MRGVIYWRTGRSPPEGWGILSGRGSLVGGGRRNASPQPAELPEPQASLDEKRVPLDQLVYQLHQLKNRAMQTFMRKNRDTLSQSNLGFKAHDQTDIKKLLLPLKILEERSPRGDVAADWFRQLQIELTAEKASAEKWQRYENATIQRGAGAELRSSRDLIKKWQQPLADVIFEEQKLILHAVKAFDRQRYGPYLLLLPAPVLSRITLNGIISSMLASDQLGLCKVSKPAMQIGRNIQQHVKTEMVRSKARRLKQQHQRLFSRVSRMDPDKPLAASAPTRAQDSWTQEWYEEWLKKLEMDPTMQEQVEKQTWKDELLKRLKEMKPYSLPDPALRQPELPLSNVVIVNHTDREALQRYHDEKEQLLARRPSHKVSSRLELVGRQIARLEQRISDEGSAVKRQLEVLEFQNDQLKKRMEKYGTADKKQINYLNLMLNRALRASQRWPHENIVKIGARLMDLAIQTLTTGVKDPVTGQWREEAALEHKILMSARVRKQGMIRLHDDVTEQLSTLGELRHVQHPLYQPMVVRPLPWLGVNFGAYLYAPSRIMRTKGNQEQIRVLQEADTNPESGISQVYEALNALGATPWRVNMFVLEVMEAAMKRKLEIGKLPPYQNTPIQQPAKRPRFVTWPGGFHEPYVNKHLASVQKTFEKLSLASPALADPPVAELVEQERAWSHPPFPAAARADTLPGWQGGEVTPCQTHVLPIIDDPEVGSVVDSLANMEASLERQNDGDEGTDLSRSGPKARMIFRRTQMQVTFTRDETTAERKERRFNNAKIRKMNRENHSMRCDLNYKMQTARQFSKEAAIYFPHSLDFRGRAYPMHPHLNHLGNDMCRGMLEFAEGRPLGEEGLGWLYIQLANVWGQKVDKRNFEGRRQFVMEHENDIIASAKDPLKNTWWQGAESAWQCLAVCKEIQGALESGDPASYVSHTPVMMDGSCNGLQHYAALGLDYGGGKSVNLTPMDVPQDVYTEVAEIVRRRVAEDVVNGVPLSSEVLGEIDRKLVKQTVMTSVYGVTMSGAKEQITNRLRERNFRSSTNAKDAFMAGTYAARKVLEGLDERFGKANKVMGWLSDCARAISKADEPVQWTTRLGLPVVQPYKHQSKVHVQTSLQRIVLVKGEKPDDAVHKIKQRTAFPPNYVHSIDSTHMMMTAIACARAGITFAGVHDSFWTHAATTPQMNRLLREKFVELYSQPILEDLQASFRERFPSAKIPELPEKGDLDITDVLDSQYFFS